MSPISAPTTFREPLIHYFPNSVPFVATEEPQSCSEKNEDEQAEQLLEKACLLNPKSVDAFTSLGEMKYTLKKYSEAIAAFKHVLELDGRDWYAHAYLLKSLCGMEQHKEADDWASTVVDDLMMKVGDDSACTNRQQANVALQRARLINNQNHTIHALIGGVYCYFDMHQEAAEELQAACQLNPNSRLAHTYLGEARYNLKQYAEAVAAFRRADELWGSDSFVHTGLALALYRTKQYDESEKWISKALSHDPSDPHAIATKANILFERQKYVEASYMYKQALEILPTNSLAAEGLATLERHREGSKSSSTWQACETVIVQKNYSDLERLFLPLTDEFWHAMPKGSTLLTLADEHCWPDHTKMLFLVRLWHARFLERFEPEIRAQKQLEQLLRLGKELDKRNPTAEQRKQLKQYFQVLTREYTPGCNHLAIVTEQQLKIYDSFYKAAQPFYAEWCTITAQAAVPLVKKRSLEEVLNFVAESRRVLALVSDTPNKQQFGVPRKLKGANLSTPIDCEAYGDWYQYTHSRWLSDNDYCIYAVGKDGRKIEGTRFDIRTYQEKEGDVKMFSWIHSRCCHFEAIHAITQEWFEEALKLGEVDAADDTFLYALGAFYHSLIQYTPLERGSAAVALITFVATFLALGVTPPRSTHLLDCFALSMQQEEFIRNVFIPFCRGMHSKQELLKQMKL